MAASREKGQHHVMRVVDGVSIVDLSMAEIGPGEARRRSKDGEDLKM
jgi:hypothetical protein